MTQQSDWQALRKRIAARLDDIAAEIRAYPYPIPACDAQYNHLLDRRRALRGELALLDRMAGDPDRTVEDFLRGNPGVSMLTE